jgi:hypothetical protein
VIVISASANEFAPHFDYEQAIFDRSRARGLKHIASFEFLPDDYLFALARPASVEAQALVLAAGP